MSSTASSSSSSSSSSCSIMMMIWSDIPRRLTTICIGVPLVVVLLSHSITTKIFWTVVHGMAAMEWTFLTPKTTFTTTTTLKGSDGSSCTINKKGKQQQKKNNDWNRSSSKSSSIHDVVSFPIVSLVVGSFLGIIIDNNSTVCDDSNIKDNVFMIGLVLAATYFWLSNHTNTNNNNTEIIKNSSVHHKKQEDNDNDNDNDNDDDNDNNYVAAQAQARVAHNIHGLLFVTTSFYHLHLLSSLHRDHHHPISQQQHSQEHQHQYETASLMHTLFLLLVVWNCDTGALVMGRMWKLFFVGNYGNMQQQQRQRRYSSPSSFQLWLHGISPQKSVAGIVGGIVFGISSAVVFPCLVVVIMSPTARILGGGGGGGWNYHYHHFGPESSSSDNDLSLFLPLLFPTMTTTTTNTLNFPAVSRRAWLGLALAVCGIMGDLQESLVKRRAQQKDSFLHHQHPNLFSLKLAGHGGILDRFDSSLLAAVIYVRWCKIMMVKSYE